MTVRDADLFPVVVGAKVTSIVQVAFTASDAGQLLVAVNWEESVPVNPIVETVKTPLPIFDNVTGTAIEVLPAGLGLKLIDIGESDPKPTPPVPVTLAVVCNPVVVSVKTTLAVLGPVAAGSNTRVIRHGVSPCTQ